MDCLNCARTTSARLAPQKALAAQRIFASSVLGAEDDSERCAESANLAAETSPMRNSVALLSALTVRSPFLLQPRFASD